MLYVLLWVLLPPSIIMENINALRKSNLPDPQHLCRKIAVECPVRRGFLELYPVPGLFGEQHEHAGYPLPDLPYVVVLALEQFPAPALMLVPVRIFAERAAV